MHVGAQLQILCKVASPNVVFLGILCLLQHCIEQAQQTIPPETETARVRSLDGKFLSCVPIETQLENGNPFRGYVMDPGEL